MYRLATTSEEVNWENWDLSMWLRWALMHDLNINIYACSYGTGSSFIWNAVQVMDSMEGIIRNIALLCLTDIARAHWPCVNGTTLDLRDPLGHLSWHSVIILMDKTGAHNSSSIFYICFSLAPSQIPIYAFGKSDSPFTTFVSTGLHLKTITCFQYFLFPKHTLCSFSVPLNWTPNLSSTM